MAITRITLFKAPGDQTPDHVQAISKEDGVTGVQLQDRSLVQLTSSPTREGEDTAALRQLREQYGEPTEDHTTQLESPASGSDDTPTNSPVMEVVVNYFPASRITPQFRDQVVADFQKFDGIIKTVAEGDGALSYGWSEGEVAHADVEGEKTRPFVILRGWRSMRDFEAVTKTERFREEAIPILMAWKAPFKMWHVEHST